MRTALSIICLLWAVTTTAATYYVRTDGSDANTGLANDAAHAWLTVQHAANTAIAGDVVRVQNTGSYDMSQNGRVQISSSGSPGSPITLIGDGMPKVRGFDFVGANWINLIGFEITHTNFGSSPYIRGVFLVNTNSHIQILDNFIHDTEESSIGGASSGGVNTWITVRGNTMTYPGHIPGLYSNSAPQACSFSTAASHHVLTEYNTVTNICDSFWNFGTNSIIRNNFMSTFIEGNYTNAPGSAHSDAFQDGSDGGQVGLRYHVYEANLGGNSMYFDSHFGLFQDTVGAGDTNVVFRGNIGFNYGAVYFQNYSMHRTMLYNNTAFKVAQTNANGVIFFHKSPTNPNYPFGGLVANQIIYDHGLCANTANNTIAIDVGCTPIVTNNLGYLAGSEPSYVSTSDPLFVSTNPSSLDFHLQAGSPARGTGIPIISITSGNGSGTTFAVNDPQSLCDGWGMVDGDTVTIGATTTTISAINWGNSNVTVAASVTWTNGQAVHWGKYAQEDIGALPYGSTALTAATISQAGSTYTVTPTGDARGVWFYVDGIPTTWVSTPPYQATIASGAVTAKAYALYAQASPVVAATAGGGIVTRTARGNSAHIGTLRGP